MTTDFINNDKNPADSTKTWNRESLLKWLKEHLTDERYAHTLGVEECARELAKRYGEDEEKAALAGLLHDCAKCLSNDKLLETIKREIKDIDKNELLNYKTFHAPVGEYFAKNKFNIREKDILSSIRCHTLGKVGMTTFEKIIFLADKIEARTREPEFREKILAVLNENEGIKGLDTALFICFKETIKSLVKRELAICPATIDVYNWLLETVKEYKK